MTDRESFLERWSRRKHDAADPSDATHATDSTGDTAPDASPGSLNQSDESKAAPVQAPKPEFDLASLPPIDSITAATDVRAFLAAGVPPELVRAALRRAWVADPAIRNFVGMADYDWDFTDPAAMPGFGDLPPGYDVRKLLTEVFGEANRADRTAAALATREPSQIAQRSQAPAVTAISTSSTQAQSRDQTEQAGSTNDKTADPVADPIATPSELVHHNKNIALQQMRRKHGGALPE